MYNSCPISVSVESLLPINKGQSVVCNANPSETAFNLIEAVCRKMCIPYQPHLFLRLQNGDVIRGKQSLGQAFGKKKNHFHSLELDTHYVSRIRWFGAALGLMLAMTAIVIAGTLFAKEKILWRYGIVADAGSSHTSFILYNWPEDHMEEVKQMAECSTTGGEGIDRFAATPEKLEDHFRPCLDTLAVELERHGVSDLSSARIYLGATAGMRLVSLISEENSTRLMKTIETIFQNSPFYYVPGDVKILTGQEEGAFSWITTNILSGTFNSTGSSPIRETADTFGSLDMGGASMQIAYECPEGNLGSLGVQ